MFQDIPSGKFQLFKVLQSRVRTLRDLPCQLRQWEPCQDHSGPSKDPEVVRVEVQLLALSAQAKPKRLSAAAERLSCHSV